MKRVRVAPGKCVVVSDGMADKAARVFASGAFTREQVREMAAAEPKGASGVFLGKIVTQAGRRNVKKIRNARASDDWPYRCRRP